MSPDFYSVTSGPGLFSDENGWEKEKFPFHWTFKWAGKGWLCWDLTIEIWHMIYIV